MADAQLGAAADGKAQQSTSLPRARVALDEISLVQHIVQRLVDVVVVDEDNRTARGHSHLDPVDLLHQLQFRHVIREAAAKEHVDLELAEQPAVEEQGQRGRIVREQHDVPRGPVLQIAAHQLQRRHSKPIAWSQERPQWNWSYTAPPGDFLVSHLSPLLARFSLFRSSRRRLLRFSSRTLLLALRLTLHATGLAYPRGRHDGAVVTQTASGARRAHAKERLPAAGHWLAGRAEEGVLLQARHATAIGSGHDARELLLGYLLS